MKSKKPLRVTLFLLNFIGAISRAPALFMNLGNNFFGVSGNEVELNAFCQFRNPTSSTIIYNPETINSNFNNNSICDYIYEI